MICFNYVVYNFTFYIIISTFTHFINCRLNTACFVQDYFFFFLKANQFFGAAWGLLLITGLRITGGAFFLGAGLGSLFTEGFDALDVLEEDLDAPEAEEEELAFCWAVVFFSGSDLRTTAAFF